MDSIQTAEGTRSKDPVCGMMVDPAAARGGSHAHNGKTYFFCNPRCRERFAADPEKYLDPAYRPGGMGGMVQLGGIAPQQTQPQLAAEGTRSKDPVCGMMVDPAAARGGSHAHKGKTYFFCNPRCRERFAADPEKYLDPAYKPGGMGGMVQLGGSTPQQTKPQPAPGTAIGPGSEPAASTGVTPQEKRVESASSSTPSTAKTAVAGGPGTAAQSAASTEPVYICPMDPEVRQHGPGICTVCGMALEPETIELPTVKTEYVCPMHPEVIREEPGSCPICGMALEPRTVSAAPQENPELRDMRNRLKVSLWLGVPLLAVAMAHMATPLAHAVRADLVAWIELLLASPIVLWCGLHSSSARALPSVCAVPTCSP